eukprot:1181857-Prorocentrum_minimum.AAC.6
MLVSAGLRTKRPVGFGSEGTRHKQLPLHTPPPPDPLHRPAGGLNAPPLLRTVGLVVPRERLRPHGVPRRGPVGVPLGRGRSLRGGRAEEGGRVPDVSHHQPVRHGENDEKSGAVRRVGGGGGSEALVQPEDRAVKREAEQRAGGGGCEGAGIGSGLDAAAQLGQKDVVHALRGELAGGGALGCRTEIGTKKEGEFGKRDQRRTSWPSKTAAYWTGGGVCATVASRKASSGSPHVPLYDAQSHQSFVSGGNLSEL